MSGWQIQLFGETTYGHLCPKCGLRERAPTYERATEMMWERRINAAEGALLAAIAEVERSEQ